MTQSMSRVAKCIDNGPMEAFWGTIKSEMYYLNKFYTTDNLINSIVEYIEFYNNKRPHKKNHDKTPTKTELDFFNKQAG